MNLDHLKYFADAAAAGGVSPAAKANYITQPGISRAIAKLEEELGVELVLHGKNRFQLTEAGRTVLAESTAVFEAVAQLKAAATLHVKTLRGPLRFACNQAIASRLVGPLLAKIEAKHPDLRVEMAIGNTDQVQRWLESSEVDFGVVVDDGEVSRRFTLRPLYEGEFIVVKSPRFKRGDLSEQILVSRSRKGGLSERYAREFERVYRKPFRPKRVIAGWQVILDLALSGFGCALVPRFLCREELKAGKLEPWRHKVGPIPFRLCAIVGKSKSFPRNAQALFEVFPSS